MSATTSYGYLYLPRMAATIIVPTCGSASERMSQEQDASSTFSLDVRPLRARWVSNSANEADTLELTVSYDEAGLDPRYMRSAEVYFYADNDLTGDFTPSFNNLRFLGMVRDAARVFTEAAGKVMTFTVHDYTSLFLECKTFPQSGIPLLSDTLEQAWARICTNTGYYDPSTLQMVSTVMNLSDRIVFLGVDSSLTLGSAMPPRLAALGTRVHMPNAVTDAWAVWKTCCESLGLITYIQNDRCFVVTATDYYTADDPPLMIWGLNVLELEEKRELGQISAQNVCVRSFDPLAGKTLEAFYPDPASPLAAQKKKLGASATKAPTAVKTQDYELLDLPFPVSDQTTLNNIAQRIWMERTRQELHGHLTTREMGVATVAGANFNLLLLSSGDQIQLQIERSALDEIQSLPSVDARVQAAVSKGYSDDMANYIATNIDSIDQLPGQFMVHTCEVNLEAMNAEGGCKYDLKIAFVNRVDILGSGAVTAQITNAPAVSGTNQPPLEQQSFGDDYVSGSIQKQLQ